MQRLLVLVVTLSMLPLAAASEGYAVVMDWQEGHFVVGTRVGIEPVDAWRSPFALDACRREVLLDLLYEPEEAEADLEGIGEVALLWEFRAEVWSREGEMLSSARITASGYGSRLGTMPEEGVYEVRLFLVTGVDVEWSARVRAKELPLDPACGGGLPERPAS